MFTRISLHVAIASEGGYEGGWSVNESPYGQMQSISLSKSLGGKKGCKANCPSVGFQNNNFSDEFCSKENISKTEFKMGRGKIRGLFKKCLICTNLNHVCSRKN
jgi:hypothetical protein